MRKFQPSNRCRHCLGRLYYLGSVKKKDAGPEVVKLFQLNSAEHEIKTACNCKIHENFRYKSPKLVIYPANTPARKCKNAKFE